MWYVNKNITPDSCPYCGNDDLESYDVDFDGEFLSIGWDCSNCGGVFTEIHKTTYEGVGMDTIFAEEWEEQKENDEIQTILDRDNEEMEEMRIKEAEEEDAN